MRVVLRQPMPLVPSSPDLGGEAVTLAKWHARTFRALAPAAATATAAATEAHVGTLHHDAAPASRVPNQAGVRSSATPSHPPPAPHRANLRVTSGLAKPAPPTDSGGRIKSHGSRAIRVLEGGGGHTHAPPTGGGGSTWVVLIIIAFFFFFLVPKTAKTRP